MLRGGSHVFRDKVQKLLICNYHTQTDERDIKALLDEYGMQHRDNAGYMLPLLRFPPKWGAEPYLRPGVTFAWR